MTEHATDPRLHQLADGRGLLAGWVGCAGEWYVLPIADTAHPITSSTLEDLAQLPAVRVFETWDEATDVLLDEVEGEL